MANELLTSDEFRDLLSSEYTAMAWSPSAIFAYKGKRIIFRDDGMIVLFEACEWCGNKYTLDKYNNCSKCGGYPTAKRTQQSVHLMLGILRHASRQAVFYALAFFQLDGFAVPAPARVAQTVGLHNHNESKPNKR